MRKQVKTCDRSKPSVLVGLAGPGGVLTRERQREIFKHG